VYYIGRAMEVGGLGLIALIITLRVWYSYLRDNWVGRERDRWSDKFPFVIYRSFQSARILKMMSLMRESDLKPIDVLQTLQKWVNPYLKWHVSKWIKGFQQGKDKNSFFGVGLLSSKQLIRLRAQQEGGGDDFSKSLMVIAEHANKDASAILYKYSSYLRRIIFFFAGIVSLFALQGFGALFVLID
jgi:type II secretory pathway component PulF